jgi:hypothetical protein
MSSDDPIGDRPGAPRARPPQMAGNEDLPYRVELWDDDKSEVEHVVAVTASASIGYAAYYAATREYPGRFITLRHRNRVLSRWNGPTH